jgi:hypothetical protein
MENVAIIGKAAFNPQAIILDEASDGFLVPGDHFSIAFRGSKQDGHRRGNL